MIDGFFQLECGLIAVIERRVGFRLDFQKVPSIVRVLLCTDGTVTRSLQAYFGEPIEVLTQYQYEHILSEADPLLKCGVGDPIVLRQVILQGKRSGAQYAFAETRLNMRALPVSLVDALADGLIGVGELLQRKGMETYRDVFSSGEGEGVLVDFVGSPNIGEYAWRHYSISHAGAVAMHIREYFPLSSYR